MDNRPIGVFDSGLGGLTAFKELRRLLPGEHILYFGDTGRVPYGTKTRETILRYAQQDIRLLLQHQVKMILAACGTVSATLPEEITAKLPVPYTGVVSHASAAACQATRNRKIGVIGTPATIKSGVYANRIRQLLPEAEVISISCALFVPLVESGFIQRENQVTRLVAEEYLLAFKNTGIDTLILGCTHYPIIAGILEEVLQKIVEGPVTFIDSGKVTAHQVSSQLRAQGLLCQEPERPGGKSEFLVSDSIEGFQEVANIFLGDHQTENCVQQIDIEAY